MFGRIFYEAMGFFFLNIFWALYDVVLNLAVKPKKSW